MKNTCAVHLRSVRYVFFSRYSADVQYTYQQNTDHSINQHKQTYPSRRRMSVSVKEGASEGELARTRMGEGSLGDLEEAEPHEGLGRQKMEGELAEIAQEDAIHR